MRNILQAFTQWLDENPLLLPIEYIEGTDQYAVFKFTSIPDASGVLVRIEEEGISIPVMVESKCFDLLAAFDIQVEHGKMGYYCAICAQFGHENFYRSVNELLLQELFKPFRQWVNHKLATANSLCLYDFGGSTMARLSQEHCSVTDTLVAQIELHNSE